MIYKAYILWNDAKKEQQLFNDYGDMVGFINDNRKDIAWWWYSCYPVSWFNGEL